MGFLEHMTNGELMILCLLVFAAVLIFPRLMRRRRILKQVWESQKKGETLLPEDFKGKQKLFYTHNAKSTEIEELLVKIKTYAFKHEMKIVFPGNFHYKDQISPTTMILVGPFGLLLLRCYGFGGHIYLEPKTRKFMQNMNETVREITNPIRSMELEKELMQLVLAQTEFRELPIYTASVFTRQGIILSVPEDSRIFDRNGLLHWLENDSYFKKDNQIPVRRLADYLVNLVKEGKSAPR